MLEYIAINIFSAIGFFTCCLLVGLILIQTVLKVADVSENWRIKRRLKKTLSRSGKPYVKNFCEFCHFKKDDGYCANPKFNMQRVKPTDYCSRWEKK